MTPKTLAFLDHEIAALDQAGLLRSPVQVGPGELLDLCSNDYLGYAREGWPSTDRVAASGASASRLVCGDSDEARAAEKILANWVGVESTLLFTSGYTANLGAISALAGSGDVIVSDALNHASLIDGCRLSGARVTVVPHLDAGAVEAALEGASDARRRWVVTESYFSMDGDSPDLVRLRGLCDQHDAGLVVDEAHALGVFGPAGAGLCAEAGVVPDVLIGTCGKALGLQGGFVAGREALRTWLWNRARPFVFSTGMSPHLAQGIGLRAARASGDSKGRVRLEEASRALRAVLSVRCPALADGRGPILPWVVGESKPAVELAGRLGELGLRVRAIRPPTVPKGTSRLRITASASLGGLSLERAVIALRSVL